jgi:O-antigen/teichoic acid export membrane protein
MKYGRPIERRAASQKKPEKAGILESTQGEKSFSGTLSPSAVAGIFWQVLEDLARYLRRSISGRTLRIFSSSVLDQAVLSAAGFAVGFMLIRLATDEEYGLYVLVLTAVQLLTAMQRAGLSAPLVLVAARRSPEARRSAVGAVTDAHRRTLLQLLLFAQIVPLGGYVLGLLTWKLALLMVLGLLAAWATLRRELLRDVLLLYSRTQSLLVADGIFAVALVLLTLAATAGRGTAALWAVGALTASAVLGGALAYRMLARNPGWSGGDAVPILRELWPLGAWSVSGALLYWLYSSASNYLLAGMLDLKAVADVNATRLAVMPVSLMTVGVSALLTPTATLWHAEIGLSRLIRRLLGFVAVMALIDVAYLLVVWLCRDWLFVTVLHKHIAQRDELLLLWAALVLVAVVRDVMLSTLYALGRVKSLATQGVLCAAVSLGLTFVGIGWWGAATGLIAQIVGELVNLVGIFFLLREALRMPEAVAVTPT